MSDEVEKSNIRAAAHEEFGHHLICGHATLITTIPYWGLIVKH